jgi:acetyl-CoA/propionyl-CoA carboxylase biotin carboxyl carrier protein
VVQAPDFTSETALGIHTRWIETDFADSIAADAAFGTSVPDGARRTITVDIDGRRLAVGLPAALLDGWARSGTGVPAGISLAGDSLAGEYDGDAAAGGADPGELRADMAGTVVKWLVEPGAEVAAGDPVVVLEAMKMETQVAAHRGGTLSGIRAEAGGVVGAGAVLALIE